MIRFALIVALALALLPATAAATVLTNKDVLTMLEGGLPEDVILQSIQTSETKFDTSANALVKLKQKGATSAILKAMMQPAAARPSPSAGKAAPATPSAARSAPARGGGISPDEVIALVEGQEVTLSYVVPGTRTAARALGFGGIATYSVMNGSKAQRRLPGTAEFVISVPKNAQAPNYVNVASFAIRDNGSREVLVGGGFMSYSTGIHPDRLMKISTEALEDQGRAKEGYTLYRVKTHAPLQPGEYALVLYTGEVRSTGGFFPQAANSYFDFGVD